MSAQFSLRKKITEGLKPLYIDVINESPAHSGPQDAESHFRVVIVSEKFKGLTAVQRHQMVYALVKQELNSQVHAFSQHTLTPEEWVQKGRSLPSSPPCAKGK